jgi:hypothetical protein
MLMWIPGRADFKSLEAGDTALALSSMSSRLCRDDAGGQDWLWKLLLGLPVQGAYAELAVASPINRWRCTLSRGQLTRGGHLATCACGGNTVREHTHTHTHTHTHEGWGRTGPVLCESVGWGSPCPARVWGSPCPARVQQRHCSAAALTLFCPRICPPAGVHRHQEQRGRPRGAAGGERGRVH